MSEGEGGRGGEGRDVVRTATCARPARFVPLLKLTLIARGKAFVNARTEFTQLARARCKPFVVYAHYSGCARCLRTNSLSPRIYSLPLFLEDYSFAAPLQPCVNESARMSNER